MCRSCRVMHSPNSSNLLQRVVVSRAIINSMAEVRRCRSMPPPPPANFFPGKLHAPSPPLPFSISPPKGSGPFHSHPSPHSLQSSRPPNPLPLQGSTLPPSLPPQSPSWVPPMSLPPHPSQKMTITQAYRRHVECPTAPPKRKDTGKPGVTWRSFGAPEWP